VDRSRVLRSRALRVSAERVFELARHLTERDRAMAFALYEHQLLTTDQLTLLFFSSKRRAQDRLRFLYDNRVVDRFYPPRPYGFGKPQAHWLLDEGGAILVAASLELERKQLGWQRRDDWGSYPQLLHRLEVNRFVTDLIAATLTDGSLAVSEWWGGRSAAARLSDRDRNSRPIPDTGFFLERPGGPIECYLEWDRGTETLARLSEKVRRYRRAQVRAPEERGTVNVLFVVPTGRRRSALVDALAADDERCRKAGEGWFRGTWSYAAALQPELAAGGPLASVWHPLSDPAQRMCLFELPVRTDLAPADLSRGLGRRWCKERPDFWQALSPLGVVTVAKPVAAPTAAQAAPEAAAVAVAPSTPIERMREQLLVEARRDIEAVSTSRGGGQ
jgi:hypothetical protein